MTEYIEAVEAANFYSHLYKTKIIPDVPLDQYSISKHLPEFIKSVKGADLIASVPFNSFLGNISKDINGFTSIFYSEQLDRPEDPRKPFTLAHEFGHSVLDHPIQDNSTENITLDEIKKLDRDADEFAGNLLLPFDVFCYQLVDKQFFYKRIMPASSISAGNLNTRIKNILRYRIGLEEELTSYIWLEYSQTDKDSDISSTMLYKILDSLRSIYEEYPTNNYVENRIIFKKYNQALLIDLENDLYSERFEDLRKSFEYSGEKQKINWRKTVKY